MISILPPMASQWSLQYFFFSGARQVQVAFAHFLDLNISLLCRPASHPSNEGKSGDCQAGLDTEIVAQKHMPARAKSTKYSARIPQSADNFVRISHPDTLQALRHTPSVRIKTMAATPIMHAPAAVTEGSVRSADGARLAAAARSCQKLGTRAGSDGFD
jgi:hypothetical protein